MNRIFLIFRGQFLGAAPRTAAEQTFGAGKAKFVYFYQKEKNCKLFCKNPLTTLDLCDKIVNCIIIALTMGTSALSQGLLSMKGDFLRRSLCILPKTPSERSIRL